MVSGMHIGSCVMHGPNTVCSVSIVVVGWTHPYCVQAASVWIGPQPGHCVTADGVG